MNFARIKLIRRERIARIMRPIGYMMVTAIVVASMLSPNF